MAPRELNKEASKTERVVSNSNTKSKETPISTMKTKTSKKKDVENTPAKAITSTSKLRSRSVAFPIKATTPKQNKEKVATPGSITKSAKKAWQRRPKPAHSGVPLPERMREMLQKGFLDLDGSL